MAPIHPINMIERLSAKDQRSARAASSSSLSLLERCRHVIEANLERYPPEALGILDEMEWEEIVKTRHNRTRPQKGSGGLDGSGRMAPAIPIKSLRRIEESVPHFAGNGVADDLVWRDCVEYKFRRGGLSRPKSLLYPWPVLVEKVQNAATVLKEAINRDNTSNRPSLRVIQQSCDFLGDTPMNVTLLKLTGVGIVVKKFLKKFDLPSAEQASCSESLVSLENAFLRWNEVARRAGVAMKDQQKHPSAEVESVLEQDAKLVTAEACQSWRELFDVLSESDDQRRSNQGARMRERRKKLDMNRPQIVKVRPSASRHNKIMQNQEHRQHGHSGKAGGAREGVSKMSQIRNEARVTSARRGIQPTAAVAKMPSSKSGGFGDAVAFASSSSKKRKPAAAVVPLGHGKRMRVPDNKKGSASVIALKQRLGMVKLPPNHGSRR